MIKFEEIIKVPFPKQTKIKFNMNAGDPTKRAYDLLVDNDDEWLNMNEWRTKQTNNNLGAAKYLITMAQYYHYGVEYFVFAGLYEVHENPEITEIPKEGIRGYKLIPTGLFKEYEKRLIIKLNKPIGRDTYTRMYENIFDSLMPEVYEISPYTKLNQFPGYENVSLNHSELTRIINNQEPMWKSMLSHIKAIYVITDKNTGKLYIGSATGNEAGLWQRWQDYAHHTNLTGSNKDFIDVKEKLGEDYIKEHFKYSILEIFDTKTNLNVILNRESYWMGVFETINKGYNN